MKLVHLIDSPQYIATDPWQHQLCDHLRAQTDEYMMVTKDGLQYGLQDSDVLLSTLKLRTAYALREQLAKQVGWKRKLYLYDQDPWESFVDTATYPGAYEAIAQACNVTFINTSKWWSDLVNQRGLRSIPTRMWVKPEYCDDGVPWSCRPIRVGFKGKLHPHRQAALQQLERMGVGVTVLPSGDYQSYLQDLSQMQFFFHEESGEKWSIKGKPLAVKNCSWAKDIEIACRGCFALRLNEPEAAFYRSGEIPGIKVFNDISEVPKIIEDALNHPDRSDLESRQSVEYIRQAHGWFNLNDL